MTFQAAEQREAATGWERHARAVLETTSRLRVASLSTLQGERGYLLTGDEVFLEPYYQGREDVMDTLDTLRDGGRVVGVVSHVPELQTRIPTQLRVHRGRHGSRTTLSLGPAAGAVLLRDGLDPTPAAGGSPPAAPAAAPAVPAPARPARRSGAEAAWPWARSRVPTPSAPPRR